jgi:uncharacterized protein (TIGR02452 family)
MSREIRIKIAEETIKILNQGYFIMPKKEKIKIDESQKFAELNTEVYSPNDTDDLIKNNSSSNCLETNFQVINDTTLNAVRDLIDNGYEKVMCLNFASAKNPGGGFLKGSSAQEESIARATGLYPCLLKCTDFYTNNKKIKSCFYTDYMIYSPNVPIFNDENGVFLNSLYKVSIITAPAVNANVVKQTEPENVAEIERVMKRRIEKVLRISKEKNYHNIVLGAWGCGVFGNSTIDISKYFKEVFDSKFKNDFKNIVFAIYSNDKKFIQPFYDNFIR